MSDQVTAPEIQVPVEAPAAPTPAVEKPAEAETSKDPTGLRDTIRKAVQQSTAKETERAHIKAGDVRDPATGKFVPKAPAAEAAPQNKVEKAPEGAQTGTVQPDKAGAAPGTWKPEARAAWASIPDHAKAEILRREADSAREVTKFQQQLKQVSDQHAEVEAVIGNRRGALIANYGSIGKALNEMFQLSDWAGKDPVAFSQWLFQQTGHNPQTSQQGQPQVDPALQPLMQEVHGLKSTLATFQNAQQQRELQSIGAEIQAWVQEKDAAGAPLRPHYDAVREQVFGLLPSIKGMFPTESPKQHMERAYQGAINMNPEVSAQIQQDIERKTRERIEADARVRKAADANKSITGGSPAANGAAPNDANDLRATIRRNLRAQNGDARI